MECQKEYYQGIDYKNMINLPDGEENIKVYNLPVFVIVISRRKRMPNRHEKQESERKFIWNCLRRKYSMYFEFFIFC